ncbi:cobaltochelatase CobT-related protein [Agrobacterium vitis]|uniref:cobaltochelatase CobT-related protein n=1 Tax=Agrobacterium vitis TaxID=373 RepID=UPI003D2A1343
MSFFEKIFARRAINPMLIDKKDYHAFTTDFDHIVKSEDLDQVLGPLAQDDAAILDHAWQTFESSLTALRAEWTIAGIRMGSYLAAHLPRCRREDIVVSLLIDHSGSMRGQSILMAAAAADAAQDFLRNLGCKVEVLGYTTASWKGGNSRKRWQKAGSPRRPGCLCDLLHIIYRSADDMRVSSLGHRLKNMLRPDLLKENIDGEALQWASERLLRAPERHKFLLVLSDGVPMDDSTFAANGADFLTQHLQQVILGLESDERLSVMAVNLGHQAADFYKTSRRLDMPANLGPEVIDMLREAIEKKLALD